MVLKNTAEPLRRERLGGCGAGAADTFPVAIPDQEGAFIMSTRLELDPGASVGYHRHEGTEEVYFIMSGKRWGWISPLSASMVLRKRST